MQARTFNIIVIICMLISVICPLMTLWGPNYGFLDLRAFVAAVLAPFLWIIGNMITGLMVGINRHLVNKLFYVQCAGSVISIIVIILGAIYLFAGH